VHGRSVAALPPSDLGNFTRGPTLPISLIYGPRSSSHLGIGPFAGAQSSHPSRSLSTPGTTQRDGNDERVGRAWRVKALTLMFSRLPSGYNPITHRLARGNINDEVDDTIGKIHGCAITSSEMNQDRTSAAIEPLTILCLHALFFPPDDVGVDDAELDELVLPYLPTHVRRDLMRLRAVEAPLTNARLHVLCNNPEGHIESELIIVGPHASLHRDYFRRHNQIIGNNTRSFPLADALSLTHEIRDGNWTAHRAGGGRRMGHRL
jgi:hypothetical protein